jgi:hypothetical protein
MRRRKSHRAMFADDNLGCLARGLDAFSWSHPVWRQLRRRKLIRPAADPAAGCPWVVTAAGAVRLARLRMERRRKEAARA